MGTLNKKTIALMICLMALLLSTGCTNWQKKYEALEVEHQNLQGLLERERVEKGQLSGQLSKDQQTIGKLQKQMGSRRSASDASGFGPGYKVSYDKNAGTITVTLPNAILFSSGKATLKKATSKELNHILSVLKRKYADRQIDVIGHTDSDPIRKSKWKDNWQLSTERSLAVLRYLTAHGIRGKQIRAVGAGASRPVASNKTATGKAKNRRVEIVVHMR